MQIEIVRNHMSRISDDCNSKIAPRITSDISRQDLPPREASLTDSIFF